MFFKYQEVKPCEPVCWIRLGQAPTLRTGKSFSCHFFCKIRCCSGQLGLLLEYIPTMTELAFVSNQRLCVQSAPPRPPPLLVSSQPPPLLWLCPISSLVSNWPWTFSGYQQVFYRVALWQCRRPMGANSCFLCFALWVAAFVSNQPPGVQSAPSPLPSLLINPRWTSDGRANSMGLQERPILKVHIMMINRQQSREVSSILMEFDRFWWILMGRVWSIQINFHRFWWILIDFDRFS